MNSINLTVNGKPIDASPLPRTHLADFLRDELHLTGTHLGCEHGICGACTLLLDGAPARACITYAAMCDGAAITSIEGLAADPAMAALRTAFSVEHALQCGYCTPGMLVTARDIVHRLPDADDDRIRLELAGNLCRCTGYNGIVKAIRRVLDLRLNFDVSPAAPLAALQAQEGEPIIFANRETPVFSAPAPNARAAGASQNLTQTLRVNASVDALWAALQDPRLVAECVPGATLISVEGTHILGEMAVSLGPIQSRFSGSAAVTYGDRRGRLKGAGQDKISKTRLTAEAAFSVAADGETSKLHLDISYSLRGALAQFARGPVVQAFADEMTGMVARNLAARLRGETVEAPRRLSAAALVWQVIRRQLQNLVGGRRDG
jgi:carbon-monoxide dehydrogenase small subunit